MPNATMVIPMNKDTPFTRMILKKVLLKQVKKYRKKDLVRMIKEDHIRLVRKDGGLSLQIGPDDGPAQRRSIEEIRHHISMSPEDIARRVGDALRWGGKKVHRHVLEAKAVDVCLATGNAIRGKPPRGEPCYVGVGRLRRVAGNAFVSDLVMWFPLSRQVRHFELSTPRCWARMRERLTRPQVEAVAYDKWGGERIASLLEGFPLRPMPMSKALLSEPTRRCVTLVRDEAVGLRGRPALTSALRHLACEVGPVEPGDTEERYLRPMTPEGDASREPVMAWVFALMAEEHANLAAAQGEGEDSDG